MTDFTDEKLLKLEEKLAFQSTVKVAKAFKKIVALLVALWPGDNASTLEQQYALSRLNVAALLEPLSGVEQTMLNGVLETFSHGLSEGTKQAEAAGHSISISEQAPDTFIDQIREMHKKIKESHERAIEELKHSSTLDDAIKALTKVNAKPVLERTTKTLVNQANNEALALVSNSNTNLVAVWVAERNACVHCLAYQGEKQFGGGYPAGLTFGNKPLTTLRVRTPPLHPNCRCTQIILNKESAPAVQLGLKREAKRSILRGWSTPSESNAIRINAARKLLNKNPIMPNSVKVYARKAVSKGVFTRGRNFPIQG